MPVAIVTGASQGLGRACRSSWSGRGWSLVIDARTKLDLDAVEAELHAQVSAAASVVAEAGDITDPDHRRRLVAAAEGLRWPRPRRQQCEHARGEPSPLACGPRPGRASAGLRGQRGGAPGALQETLPFSASHLTPVVNVTSDAAVEAYEGWGGYGSSKAALDHLSAVLAVEETAVRVWAVDPGDMRTKMHQDAFPGEDISDRPDPATVVPTVLALIEGPLPSGRYRAADLALTSTGGGHRDRGRVDTRARRKGPSQFRAPPRARGVGPSRSPGHHP